MSAKETELLVAAASGDITTIQRIMSSEKTVNVNYQNEEGISALHLAAMNGHYAVAEMLLKINFNKELKDRDAGETALHKSALHGHTNVLELLLQKGADKEARSKNKSTPLHLAAQGGHTASVECLISHQADVDSVDVQGFTPLMHAAVYNHTSVVQVLLENSCDVNDTNKEGATALHLASEKGHKETTQLLISWGADVERGDMNGMTALMHAARAGHADIVELLIEYGALIENSSQSGWTALMYAVKENQLASAEMLCNKGASVNHCDQSGQVPLQLAVESGFCEVTEMLINRDAQTVVLTQEGGQSLLMLAATNGFTEIVALLKEEGADVNQINAVDGNTALHYASLFGRSETVKFLIEHCHADTSIVNEENHSARALAFTAETKDAFPPDTSFFGKVKGAWEGLFGKPASSPAESTTTADSFNLKNARWRHQRLLQEGQHLLARYEWIKKRDSLHADLESALKSGDYKQIQSRRLLLDEHEKTSSRIGIRESRYYTFPVRLLQSYHDLEASSTKASEMPSAEVYQALDTKLQVLSQQRAGKDGIPLKNALTDKNYTIEELFREIEVLQQAVGVPRTDPSAPADSLPYGEKLVFEKELQSLLTQLVGLQGSSTSSARGVADRSATGSGGDKWQRDESQPTRVFSVQEFTQEMNELKVLAQRASEKSTLTAQAYTVDQLILRVHDLQQVLSGVTSTGSDLSAPPVPAGKYQKWTISRGVRSQDNSLHLLQSQIRKECPSLVWFYPKNSMFWLNDPVQYLLNDTLMMVFVCPSTWKVMECGPRGTGWEVRAPREFLKKPMPVVLLSIFAMQKMALKGIPVSIPLSWQNSPVSVATALIPRKVVSTALKEKFDADHFMRCLSAFTDAMQELIDPHDLTLTSLYSKVKLQQDGHSQKQDADTFPHVSLGTEFPSAVFEESYSSIQAFLTTGDNAKLGTLEDQLRKRMERAMTGERDVQWVSRERFIPNSKTLYYPLALMTQKTPESMVKRVLYEAGKSWLAERLKEKAFDKQSVEFCEQMLMVQEAFDTENTFAQISPEEFNADYLQKIGIVGLCIQSVLISVHKEAVKNISAQLMLTPEQPAGDDIEIKKRLQVIYDEFAVQKQISAAERLARDGYVRPATRRGDGAQNARRPVVPPPPGPAADGGGDGGDEYRGGPGELREPCCPHCDRMTLIAARKGHLACLGYAIQHYPIHVDCCTAAAAGNFVDCLVLLRENNAEWSDDTTRAAALNDSLDALHYLLENNCDYGDDLLLCAAEGNSVACVHYLVEERGLKMNETVFGAAFERAHQECVRFLLDYGCPFSGYSFKKEIEWYVCRGYHTAPDVDERFLWCILWTVERGWSLNDYGVFECPNLVGYILDNPNTFPLCKAHVIYEGWQA